MPVNSTSANGIGISPTGISKGTKVFGIWLDQDKTIPMILGTMHADKTSANGVNDVNSINRTSATANGGIDQTYKSSNQQNDVNTANSTMFPIKPYDGKVTYPNSYSHKTSSGNEIFINDSPGNECIRFISKAGSLFEMTSDDRVVIKGNNLNTVSMGDSTNYSGGNQTIEIHGNVNLHIKGTATFNIDSDVSYNVKGKLSYNVDGDVTINTSGALNTNSSTGTSLKSNGVVELMGSPVESTPITII